MNISIEALLIIFALSGIAVLQYFKGRRFNLELMKYTTTVLEKKIEHVDRVYRLVGLYVGYRAVFWINRGYLNRLEVTVLLAPRYSALYYPFSKLITRFDRVYLTYWFDKDIIGEAHIVREGGYKKPLNKVIKNMDKMQYSETIIKGYRFHLIYQNQHAIRKLVRFVETLRDPSSIIHVALVPQNNSLYIFSKLDVYTFEDLVEKSYRFAKNLV